MANEIDPATVQRCIEVLRGKGEHEYRRVPYSRDREECWTYTTHPVDLLQALLPEPEKSEADKLVDEWCAKDSVPWLSDEEKAYHAVFAKFVLDKKSEEQCEAMVAIPIREAVTSVTTDSQPQYVFGPWIEWHGSKCPVPDDWEVQWLTCRETTERFNPVVLRAEDLNWKRDHGALTQYRVCFEVGKWYDWAGGACPVLPEQKISIGDSWATGRPIRGDEVMWYHRGIADITRFKCVAPE